MTSEVNNEQVTDGKIVIAVDPSQTEGGDVEFPDRCVLYVFRASLNPEGLRYV